MTGAERGGLRFADDPKPGLFRLLIEEHEHVHAHPRGGVAETRGRLIYAETFELDRALLR